jgi:hypothetical protein
VKNLLCMSREQTDSVATMEELCAQRPPNESCPSRHDDVHRLLSLRSHRRVGGPLSGITGHVLHLFDNVLNLALVSPLLGLLRLGHEGSGFVQALLAVALVYSRGSF